MSIMKRVFDSCQILKNFPKSLHLFLRKYFAFICLIFLFFIAPFFSFGSVDLTITGATVPTSMYAAGAYSVSYTVKNIGSTSTSTTFVVSVFISSSSTYGSGATWLADISYSGMSTGASVTNSTTITIPSTYVNGTKYIIGVVNPNVPPRAVTESNYTNNEFDLSTLIETVDLTPTGYSLSTSSIMAGNSLTAYCQEKNTGANTAGSNVISVFICNSTILNPGTSGNTWIGDISVSSCCGGCTTSTLSTSTINIPNNLSSGTYYIFFACDGNQVIIETNKSNNFAYIPITVSACSLGAPSGLSPGGSSSSPPTITTLTPTLQWNSVSNATCYGVYIVDNGSNSFVYDNNTATTTNSFTVPSGILVTGHEYRWNCLPNSNCNTGSCSGSYPSAVYFNVNTCVVPSTTNPSYTTVTAPSSAGFSVTTGGTNTSIQWQYNSGSGWFSVPNSTPYSGVTTSTLTINPSSTSLSGYQYRCYITSSCTSSTATSNPATLTVNALCSNPSLSGPSAYTVTTPSSTANFSVTPSGGSGYTYQWQVNTGSGYSNISSTGSNPSYSGFTSATLGLSGVTTSHNGYQYKCIVTNGSPCTSYSTTSNPSNLSVVCGAVYVATQPKNKAVQTGSTATFSVVAGGASPFTYQWYKNNVAISGEIGSSHTTTPTVIGDNGYTYYCIITNCSGSHSIQTNTVNLTVTETAPDNSTAIGDQTPQFNSPEPVQVGTGTYIYRHTQITIKDIGALPFTIYYNSYNHNKDSCLGYGMCHSFTYYVVNRGDTAWDVHYPDGHRAIFIPLSPTGNFSNPLNGGTYDSLIKTGSGWTLITKEKVHLYFNTSGKPLESVDPNGNITRLVYNGIKLDSAISPGGRWYKFKYNASNKIDSVISQSGRSCYFLYDGSNNLVTASEPAGDYRQFRYDSYHQMDTVIDEKGVPIVMNRYDSQNRVVCQKDAYLDSTLFGYLSNNWTKITFPGGATKSVHHDTYIRVDSIYDESGYLTVIHYDKNNNPDTLINQNSELETRNYDFHGNLTAQNLIDNRNYSATYDSFCKPVSIIDARHNTSSVFYDANGIPDSVQLANGATEKFAKNTNGTIKTLTDGEGNVTKYYYDSYQQIDSITYPWNGAKRFYHGLDGRLDSFADENGHLKRIYYDVNFNVIRVKDAMNQNTYFTYDLANQVISFTDKRGIISQFHNDKKGRLTAILRALGVKDSFGFDGNDNILFWLDANQHIKRYIHNGKNQLTSVADSSGKDSMTYDGVGNIATLMDAAGIKLSFGYEHTNQVQKVTDALNNTYTTNHDQVENISKVTNALTYSHQYQYNGINLLDSVKDPNGNKSHYSYDKNGAIISLTDNNNLPQYYHYTHRRLDKYTDGSGNIWQYYYDLAGNDTLVKTPTGTIGIKYDAINRPVKVIISSGETYIYGHDPDNNITSVSCSLGTSYFVYDSLNRLTKYTDPFGNIVQYTYDLVGNRTSVKCNSSYTATQRYDADNRLKAVTDLKGKTFTYTRDAAGKEKRLDYPNGDYDICSYDAAGRQYKKQGFYKSGKVMFTDSFGLDANGQRHRPELSATFLKHDTVKFAYADNNALITAGKYTLKSDNSGNVISAKSTKDSASYTFTVDGRLKSYTRKGNEVTSGFDAFGVRVSRTVNGYQTNLINDIGNPLVEILQMTDKTGRVKWNFTYGPGLIGMIDSTGKSYYVHSDCSHNVVAITDDNDSLIASYTYPDPFGDMVVRNAKISQPFTFGGEYGIFEEDSSFYNIRARCYDAAKECFIQPDPLPGSVFNPQSLYNYAYGLNNPSSIYDLTGLHANKDNSGSTSNFSSNFNSELAQGVAASQGISSGLNSFSGTPFGIQPLSDVAEPGLWKLGNATRGSQVEDMLGMNLPKTFPTIDNFDAEEGIATSLKTLDINAASYQNLGVLNSRITNYINKLSDFDGATFHVSSTDETINITSEMIAERQLLIVMPGEGTVAQQAVLEGLTESAADEGVELIFLILL